jgi:hypothetical protein
MAIVENSSWTGMNNGAGVLQHDTPGTQQDPNPPTTTSIPLPGSAAGAIPSGYATSARAVYPVYDGVTEINGVRQSLAIDPRTGQIDYSRYPASFWNTSGGSRTLADNPPDFTNWHSAFQAEYIVLKSNGANPPAYTIGTSPNFAAIYMLDDKNRPVNLLGLTVSDYARLTPAEKSRFQANLVASGHLGNLGLSIDAGERNNLVVSLNALSSRINATALAAEHKLLFTTQIAMLINEATAPAAFSADKIQSEAQKIMKRFEIVELFMGAARSQPVTVNATVDHNRTIIATTFDFENRSASSSNLVRTNVSNLNNNETIDSGFAAFLRAETEILNMKQRRELIAQNSAYRDPNMDVPNLIYQLQLLYEGESKGVVDAGTEEFRQLHKLLEDYNVMQQLLSTTLAAFNTAKNDDKRRFMNIGGKTDGGIDDKQVVRSLQSDLDHNYYDESYSSTSIVIDVESSPYYHWSFLANYSDPLRSLFEQYAEKLRDPGNLGDKLDGDTTGKLDQRQMIAFSMFADEPWAGTTTRAHPIEILYGAERPKFDLVDQSADGAGSLKLHSKNAFDQFQTQLSNTITILNQQNQLKQNEIESATKAQNRHFELGNNALRKMNDMLMMIGRM